ncbi:unnamed protein product [Rotaria sordida]|uniref:Uncharacterized protein n=1 Tax=Rotaria sordida TaxID=392033 RepID=A0A819UH74_9BILA|nr:unnamed protein product [Rotaria sordida]CAF4103034.1 unnamed protein product [Rotaria sordida]
MFLIKSFSRFEQYDKVVFLLRHMLYLEKLTLYLPIKGRNKPIDGTYIQNDILVYMPQLHSFTFYIYSYVDTSGLSYKLSNEHIQQTLKNIAEENVASIVNYICMNEVACSIFSIPFAFDHLEDVGNKFPNLVFSYVTYLLVQDNDAFKHEFFIRIARSFPLLKHLRIFNIESQLLLHDLLTCSSDKNQLYSIVKYPYLTSLDVKYAHEDYLDQFLNETKAYVPCLTQLGVMDIHLNIVTKNFTREETRHNCAKVKQLFVVGSLVHSNNFYDYFPSFSFSL